MTNDDYFEKAIFDLKNETLNVNVYNTYIEENYIS